MAKKKKIWQKVKPIYLITGILALIAIGMLIWTAVKEEYTVQEVIAYSDGELKILNLMYDPGQQWFPMIRFIQISGFCRKFLLQALGILVRGARKWSSLF